MLTLRFMLQDDDETEVGYTASPVAPRVGEIVWLQNTTAHVHETGAKQMTSFRVVDVAYWMNNHSGGFSLPSGSVAVFVEPIK